MKILQKVVAGGLIFRDGKVLLQKRIDPLPEYNDKWNVPAGGVEPNEHPRDTVVREIKEELDLNVKIIQMLPIVESFPNHRGKKHLIYLVFLCDLISGEPKNLDLRDASEIGWFEIDVLNKIPLIRGELEAIKLGYQIWQNANKV